MTSIDRLIKPEVASLAPYKPPATVKRSDIVAKMDFNENPFPLPRKILNALKKAIPYANYYPMNMPSLLEKIAEYVGLAPNNVILGTGSDQLIDLVTKAFLRPNDESIISIPTFGLYEVATRLMGGIPKFVPMLENFEWDIDGILSSISEKTKLIFICSPNNPTGNMLSEDKLRIILENDAVVVVDEAYAEFCGRSFSPLVNEYENLVILRTFSKAFGLAGMRIGYALANKRLVEYLGRLNPPFPVSSIAVEAAILLLDNMDYVKNFVKYVRRERERMERKLEEIKSIKCYPSVTNFMLINTRKTGKTAKEIADYLRKEGILVRDCSVFRGLDEYYIRVSIGTRNENELFIAKLREFLSQN